MRPRLNVNSSNLVHLENVPDNLQWSHMKREINDHVGRVIFVEDFTGWNRRKNGHVILDFGNVRDKENFLIEADKGGIFSHDTGVRFHPIREGHETEFFERVFKKTGVNLRDCQGVPPAVDTQRRQRGHEPSRGSPYHRRQHDPRNANFQPMPDVSPTIPISPPMPSARVPSKAGPIRATPAVPFTKPQQVPITDLKKEVIDGISTIELNGNKGGRGSAGNSRGSPQTIEVEERQSRSESPTPPSRAFFAAQKAPLRDMPLAEKMTQKIQENGGPLRKPADCSKTIPEAMDEQPRKMTSEKSTEGSRSDEPMEMQTSPTKENSQTSQKGSSMTMGSGSDESMEMQVSSSKSPTKESSPRSQKGSGKNAAVPDLYF